MRIIIAANDADFRLAMQLMLSEEPGFFFVGSASDCKGLLALIESTHPDVALVEWELPYGTMEEVFSKVNSLEKQVKIIVTSRDETMKVTALNLGAESFINIADPPDKLLSAFQQILIDQRINQQRDG